MPISLRAGSILNFTSFNFHRIQSSMGSIFHPVAMQTQFIRNSTLPSFPLSMLTSNNFPVTPWYFSLHLAIFFAIAPQNKYRSIVIIGTNPKHVRPSVRMQISNSANFMAEQSFFQPLEYKCTFGSSSMNREFLAGLKVKVWKFNFHLLRLAAPGVRWRRLRRRRLLSVGLVGCEVKVKGGSFFDRPNANEELWSGDVKFRFCMNGLGRSIAADRRRRRGSKDALN